MKFKELIDELEEFVEDAGKIPLSGGKCLINKEELFGIIEQIRLTYPEDIKQAEYVKKERDRILQDAEKEAQAEKERTKAIREEMRKFKEEISDKDNQNSKLSKKIE